MSTNTEVFISLFFFNVSLNKNKEVFLCSLPSLVKLICCHEIKYSLK